MTDKKSTTSNQQELDALEVENAAFIEMEESSVAAKEQSTNATKSAKTGLLWLVTLLNLIAIVAVSAAGYWFWQQYNNEVNTEDNTLQQQQSAIDQQAQQLQSLDRSLQSLPQQLQAQTEKLQQQVSKLSERLDMVNQQAQANSKNLADVSGRRPSDWLLAEADYLVRMAGRKLWLEHDVRTAIAMLQAADSRLQDLADPSLLPVRQFISNDIQTLEQINPVSTSSIALALSSMVQQVNNLPLALPEVEVEGPAPEELSGFERFARYISDNFKYQANSEPLKPLLSQQQQWLAKEQLRYAILQSQSAVLDDEEALFKQNLQRAIGLIVEHYDLASSEVDGFLSSLQNLEQTSIAKKYPQQLDAAQPLQDIVEQRMSNVFSNGKLEL